MGDAVRVDFGSGSDPTVADTDGDGMADGEEVAAGRSAPGPDDDFDGLPDVWERRYGLDPLVDDGTGDVDGDGLDNLTEYRLGTDPTAMDSDGDGLNDADEVGGRVTRQSGLPPMDVSDVTEWVSFAGKKEDGWVYLDLPAAVTIGGVAYPRVAYHADGLLAFVPADVADLAAPGEPQPLADALLDPRFPTFALYWADLALVPDYLSQVRAGVLVSKCRCQERLEAASRCVIPHFKVSLTPRTQSSAPSPPVPAARNSSPWATRRLAPSSPVTR